MNPGAVWELLKQTYADWSEDKAPRLGAALAYYAIFSLAPLLVIVVGVVSLVFGDDSVGQIQRQFEALLGAEAAQTIADIIANDTSTEGGLVATLIGLATLLFGASGVFGQLQDALNTIWEVQPRPDRGWMGMIKDRFFSFTMVLGVAFLLLVSLIVSAALATVGDTFSSTLPGGETLWQVINFVVSFAIITVLFALIFKIVPDVEIAWHDVWIGAAATALLFVIGKILIGLYLGHSSVGSAYGAAGTLLVILVWIYYSAQILFLGAEFTQVYANKYGTRVVAAKNAVPVTQEQRAQEGMPSKEQLEVGEQVKHGRPRSPQSQAALAQHIKAEAHPAANRHGRNPEAELGLEEEPKTLTLGSALVGFAGLGLGYLVGFLRRPSRHQKTLH
jgi:membrane protein